MYKRQDLYYRLNVVKIELPPLRERKEDIPLLIDHLLARACEKNRLATKQVDKAALKILCDYDWPGNVRQLAHEIERMLIFAGDEDVLGAELVSVGTATGGGASLAGNTNKRVAGQLKDAMEQLEREMITATLEQTGWNKSETARVLGISRSNLIAKIQGYGLEE